MPKISQYIKTKSKIIILLFYFLTIHSCSNDNRIYFKKDFYRAEDVKCISSGNYSISEFNFGATIKNGKLIGFDISLYINLGNLDKQEKEYFRKTNTIYLQHKNEIYELVFDENLSEYRKWTRFTNLEFKDTEKKQMLMKQLLTSNDIDSVFNNCNDFFNKSTFFIEKNGEKEIICISKDIFTGLSIYNEIKPNENTMNSCSF